MAEFPNMSATVSTPPSAPLSERQREALLKLLVDEDAAVYQTIRRKILSCGPEAASWMRRHILSSDPVLRRRAQEIIQHLARQETDNQFLTFCLNQGEVFDAEEAIWLLARTQYPDINVAAYQALLDSFAGELVERIDYQAPAEQILGTVNQFLYEELRYAGNEEAYYDPENSYLNRVMDRRTGNPISLCLIYIFLARRLHLPVTGIGMPGHFLCRYQAPTAELFVDPFYRGKFLSKADCIGYLRKAENGYHEGDLEPAGPRRILLRVCSNLHRIYADLAHPEDVARFQRYTVALSR